MLFSSMTFVYIFLPLVCIAYFFVRPETRNCLLLLASIIFYGWGEPNYLAVMIMTIVLNYTGALLLDRYRAWKLPIVIVTIVLDLSFLCYFKYFNFVAENINGLFSLDIKFIEVIMPIGISFTRFRRCRIFWTSTAGTVRYRRICTNCRFTSRCFRSW